MARNIKRAMALAKSARAVRGTETAQTLVPHQTVNRLQTIVRAPAVSVAASAQPRSVKLSARNMTSLNPKVAVSAKLLRPNLLALDLRKTVTAAPATPDARTAPTVRDAALALAAKVAEAAALDEQNEASDRFLAFTRGAIPIDLANEFDLLLQLNLVPEIADAIWQSPTRLLWNVWEEEFLEVEVADVPDSPSVLEARRRAREVLTKEDGTDSEKFSAYLEWQQAYIRKLEDIAMTPDSDADLHRALAAELEQINTSWLTRGFKQDIEDALDVLASLGQTSPLSQFADARDRRDNLIFRRTDPVSLMEYPKTHLLPPPENLSWSRFDLSADEVQRLSAGVEERFPSFKDSETYQDLLVEPNTDPSAVDRVSGELAVIGVDRPWFNEDLLASRAWRVRDGDELFCDGETPSRGRLPAYPVKAILARGIDLEGKHAAVSQRPQLTGANRATALLLRGKLQVVESNPSKGQLTLSPSPRTPQNAAGPAMNQAIIIGFLMETPGLTPDPDPSLF